MADNKIKHISVHFNILSSNVDSNATVEEGYVLNQPTESHLRSPALKKSKQGTPMKEICVKQHTNYEHTDGVCNVELQSSIQKMIDILPSVAEHMGPQKFQLWLNFFQMIRTDIFPEDNICYQLFQDVITFYMHRNIHAMHYSAPVKQFWALGTRLFKGRFVRFYGWINGHRHAKHDQGQEDTSLT